ncbi:hydrolase [Cryobacterium zongtaii]|uniref:Hydrolase n=1 Tax=Cryobacterium zongtaii TaxID=1259217 RepID=A0A2S3ZGD8_9MICO|nr:MBL fold metallo-hydrolase [Cryobacterium zongtaii]POH66446.1 hydrolase [Cryobacterium zongtaii]
MSFWICATCGVEHAENTGVCAICADERQWVPAGGQRWTTLTELHEADFRAELLELEPDLFGIESTPTVGIGQQTKLLSTPTGSVLWDPIGFVDDDIAGRVLERGPVRAIVASHPHMFGLQVEWSRALGGAPVLVAEADLAWVARPDPVIRAWSGEVRLLPGVTLMQVGGHFPGSAVLHWAAGAAGRGVLLSGDTVFANPDRTSVSFMRSYPNRLPLSGPVVERIARTLERLTFDRLYGNFDTVIAADARGVVRRSADRHWGWARGDFDDLT